MKWSYSTRTLKLLAQVWKKRLINSKRLCLSKLIILTMVVVLQEVVVVPPWPECLATTEHLILLYYRKELVRLRNRWKMYREKLYRLKLRWKRDLETWSTGTPNVVTYPGLSWMRWTKTKRLARFKTWEILEQLNKLMNLSLLRMM